MRNRWMLGMIVAAAAFGPAAHAQATNDTNIPTETQDRLRHGVADLDYLDLLGLFGLFGLLGLRKEHADDSYHPSSLD